MKGDVVLDKFLARQLAEGLAFQKQSAGIFDLTPLGSQPGFSAPNRYLLVLHGKGLVLNPSGEVTTREGGIQIRSSFSRRLSPEHEPRPGLSGYFAASSIQCVPSEHPPPGHCLPDLETEHLSHQDYYGPCLTHGGECVLPG